MSTWRWLGDIQAGTSGQRVATGSGSPEGVITAPVGSLYLRSDGSTNSAVYIKETGVGNTGWIAVGAGGTTIALRHNGVDNVSQTTLDLIAGTGVTLTDNGVGGLTIDTATGIGSGSMSVSSVIQSSPLTVNLSTEGIYDWMYLNPPAGSLLGDFTEAGSYNMHWKLLNGRMLSGFRDFGFVQNASGVNAGNIQYSSNLGDDASISETAANAPMSSRTGGFFFSNNSSTSFPLYWGFQFRDIPLPDMTTRVLKFYVTLSAGSGTFTARLSDGSAADAVAVLTEATTGFSDRIITLNVTPGSLGARLNVTWVVTANSGSPSANGARIGFSAATMA